MKIKIETSFQFKICIETKLEDVSSQKLGNHSRRQITELLLLELIRLRVIERKTLSNNESTHIFLFPNFRLTLFAIQFTKITQRNFKATVGQQLLLQR